MKRVLVLALVVLVALNCRKTEPDELSAVAEVLNTDACDAGPKQGTLLRIKSGPDIGLRKKCAASNSNENIMKAVNLPDSLNRMGLTLRIRFRLARQDEQIYRACEIRILPECELVQIKLIDSQR